MYKYLVTDSGLFYIKHYKRYYDAEIYTAVLEALREMSSSQHRRVDAAIFDLSAVSSFSVNPRDGANTFVFDVQYKKLLAQVGELMALSNVPVCFVMPSDSLVRSACAERVSRFGRAIGAPPIYSRTLASAVLCLGFEQDESLLAEVVID